MFKLAADDCPYINLWNAIKYTVVFDIRQCKQVSISISLITPFTGHFFNELIFDEVSVYGKLVIRIVKIRGEGELVYVPMHHLRDSSVRALQEACHCVFFQVYLAYDQLMST